MTPWASGVARIIAEQILFKDGDRILVAVSGGVDSMVLLHLLHDLAGKHEWLLEVAHFNHQLRGVESDEDERFVAMTAGSLGLPFHADRADVRAHARLNSLSLEMAGRNLRHLFLAETVLARKCRVVALAHNLDDQIELFFLRLLRGTGLQGLAGMAWRSPSPVNSGVLLARPLLGKTKAEILGFARARPVPFREDASNHSLEIPRNRIRHQLIPLLEQWQPNLKKTVWRLMQIAAAESDATRILGKLWMPRLDLGFFEDLSVALQRRILESQLIEANIPVSFDLVEKLRLHRGTRVSTPSGRIVARNKRGWLDLAAEADFDSSSLHMVLDGASGYATLDGVEITWQHLPDAGGVPADGRATGVERFDIALLGEVVTLRHWLPGDRYQPAGMKYAKKLQDLFVDLKVPRQERRRRLAGVTSDGRIFWVEGLRISEQFKITPKTMSSLEWRWHRPKTSIAASPGSW